MYCLCSLFFRCYNSSCFCILHSGYPHIFRECVLGCNSHSPCVSSVTILWHLSTKISTTPSFCCKGWCDRTDKYWSVWVDLSVIHAFTLLSSFLTFIVSRKGYFLFVPHVWIWLSRLSLFGSDVCWDIQIIYNFKYIIHVSFPYLWFVVAGRCGHSFLSGRSLYISRFSVRIQQLDLTSHFACFYITCYVDSSMIRYQLNAIGLNGVELSWVELN